MTNKPEIFQTVGKIKDAHGLKGEVFVLIFSKDTTWDDELTHAKIESTNPPGLTKILEVERLKEHKEGLIIKFKSVDDRNQSEALKGWSFSIPEEILVSEEGETIYLKEVLDFQVFLKDQFVGYVKSFSSNGLQDLLIIQHDDHQFEVPFVSDFILNIDFEANKLFMDFPEGLMNLDKVD